MSQDTLNPRGVPGGNAPAHDPAATPAPTDRAPAAALERTDLFALAEQVAQSMDASRIDVRGSHAVVPTHQGMLRPTLRLLLEDALRGAGDEGRVQVQIRVEGFDVDILVQDPGNVPPEISGAGAGLAQANPLVRRLGARLQLSLDQEGQSEVRLRLPRLDPDRTLLVVGGVEEHTAQAAARLGLSTLRVSTVEEALECSIDNRDVRAALILPSAWTDANPRDVLALCASMVPAPVMSIGPAPDVVSTLVKAVLPETLDHRELREALQSAETP